MNNPLNIVRQYMGMINSNPMLSNVAALIKSGNDKEAEKIARNFIASQGMDFDTELNKFKSSVHMR